MKLQKHNATRKYIIIFNLKISNKASMKDILDQHLIENKLPNENKYRKIFYVLASLQLIGSIIAVTLAWIEIESIIGSGPILSVLGIIVFSYASLAKDTHGLILGIIPIVASCISLCAIYFLEFSPNEARIPISSLLGFFLLISLLLFIFSLMRRN